MSNVTAGAPQPDRNARRPAVHAVPADRTAPRARAEHAAKLRLQPRGVVGLCLYFALLAELRARANTVHDVVIDLSLAGTVTDSGCAALLAIDRLAARDGLGVVVLDAGRNVVRRMTPLCPATAWHPRAGRAATSQGHSLRASSS